MRTETITIYKFDELPTEDAKNRARDWWRSISDFSWTDENRDSIEKFCEHFGVRLLDWSVGAHSQISYETDATNHHFRGMKLRQFNRDHMPTGYWLDCSLWITFYDEFKRTGNAKAAFDAAVWAGFKDWRGDMEFQLENEYIDELLVINEYEFTEDGERV